VAYDEALASRLRAVLAACLVERSGTEAPPGVEEKRMFGGLTFMVGGQMCCGVFKDDLVVRIGPERFAEAVAEPHVRAMDFTGRPMTGMIQVAPAGVTTAEALAAWVQRGLDYVASHPRTAKRRR